MRHRVAHRKLGRVTEHRLSLLRNQAQALLRHERIETTVPKAKEVRSFVERIITVAKRGNAATVDGASLRGLNARRQVLRDIPDKEIVTKLFDVIAPRFAGRPGGYTRILRTGFRRGDSAETAQLELVGSEFNPKAAGEKKKKGAAKAQPKGMRGRLAAAAERLRGGRRAGSEEPEEESETPAKGKRSKAEDEE
jgi:large subunit ribosomal protein L17